MEREKEGGRKSNEEKIQQGREGAVEAGGVTGNHRLQLVSYKYRRASDLPEFSPCPREVL